MDWSALKQSEENIKKIKKLQKECLHLSDAVFQVDLFLKPDISAQVIAYLAEHYELNTQRGYNVALNNCYVQLGLSSPYAPRITEINAEYAELKKGQDTTVSPADYQHCTAIVDRVISGNQAGVLLGIKVMCALLKYRIDVSLAEMIEASFTASANRYNADTWIIDGKIVPLSKAFQEYIRTLWTDREYLVVKPSGQKYDQIKSLSKSFDVLFGKSFLKVKHVLRNPPSGPAPIAPPVGAPSKLKLVLKGKAQVSPPVAEPIEPAKKKLKLKLKVPNKDPGMPWENFRDTVLQEVSNDKLLAHVKRLTKYVSGADDKFYFTAFDSEEGYAKVILYFTEEKINQMNAKVFHFSWETIKTYIYALCKYLKKLKLMQQHFSLEMYDRFKGYAEEVNTHLANSKRTPGPVAEFTNFLPTLRKIIQEKKKVQGFRILCSMIVHNLEINEDDETESILRMFDLRTTRFVNDGVHSYIDMGAQTWHLVRNNRVLPLPVGFIADIKLIYGTALPEWLLVDKAGNRYDKMASLSNMFQRFVGTTYSTIRASYGASRNGTQKK